VKASENENPRNVQKLTWRKFCASSRVRQRSTRKHESWESTAVAAAFSTRGSAFVFTAL
jgi:hypothetical protein